MEIRNSQHVSRFTLHVSRFTQLKISSWTMVLGLLLTGIGGAFLPWIWRESVAPQLTGPGLAEFVKFLPEVRTQQIDIERLSFLLPLFVSMLTLPIVVENKKLDLPTWLRWTLRLAVIPLALASISPVWAPQTLIDQEFRLQTLLAGLAIGLAVVAPLLKNLPLKLLAVLLLVSGLTAIVLPMWQFSLIRPSMVETYQEPVSLNWGWWLTVGGIVSGIAGGIYYAAFHETVTNGK